jgi:hypothetical protein
VKRTTEHDTPQPRETTPTGAVSGQGRFSLGQIVATPAALEVLQRAGQKPWDFLARHVRGEWGEVDADDWAENEVSLREGFRLLSVYTTKAGETVWIISEADRSVTTLLLPADY